MGDAAIVSRDTAQVRNGFAGTIRGGRTALDVGPGSQIENGGLIEGGTDAVIRVRAEPSSGDEAPPVLVLNEEGAILNRAPGGDGIVVEGLGLLDFSNLGRFKVEGVAVLAEGSADVFVSSSPIIAGEAGIVAGDGSSITLLEDSGDVSAIGGAVRFRRDAVISADGAVNSLDGDAASIVDGEVTMFEDTGRLFSTRGAGLRIRAPEQGEAPAGPVTVDLLGDGSTIAGAVGIAVEPGNTARQTVFVEALGVIEGDLGVAMDLGLGDDGVSISSGATVEGDVLFGPGNDRLTYERSMFGTVMDAFGVFDGGPGFDVASFKNFGLGDFTASPVAGGFEFLFEDGPSQLTATLTGFERIQLDDVTLDFPSSPNPAPVPLPAGLPLLVGAIGGLFILRHHRKPQRSYGRTSNLGLLAGR